MANDLHIIEHTYQVTRQQHEQANGHKAACLWFTGLSGAGKSTIANRVEQELFNRGIKTFNLDGDNLRKGLSADLTFTEEDRNENLRRIGEVAKLMNDAGLVVVAAFISPLKKQRELLREVIGPSYNEIFVDTSIGVCEQRDVKGLYKKARAGQIPNFTGISSPFEAPVSPEIHINTASQTLQESVNLILENMLPKIQLSK